MSNILMKFLMRVSFLTIWLSYYVFCLGSLHIAKSFIPLVIQLHEGRQISLAKLLLVSLYHSLGLSSLKLKLLHSTPKALNLSGPLWLLQHWLNATFEYKLGYLVSKRIMHLTQKCPIEGVRLALTTYQEVPNKTLFMKYINLFSETTTFVSGKALFADRNFGPTWFTNPFPGVSPQTAAHSNVVWRAFLTPTMLSFRIKTGTKGYGFMNYQPNLVAQQFGLS